MSFDQNSTWYQKDVGDVLRQLEVDVATGLNEREAAERLGKYGPNDLIERGGRKPLLMLWEQFTSSMVLILMAAALISGFLGKATETVAILAIVLLFALLGFFQEYRAEQAMAALKKLSKPIVRVRRNEGATETLRELPAGELVPGDILLLEAGNLVPADVRIVESVNLRIEEAALTGESEAVEKESEALPQANLPLGDRRNMGYMGTIVSYGRGTAVVVETGMNTELGKIANLIQSVEDEMTPLQQQLDGVGKMLAIVGVIVAAIVMLIGVLQGEAISSMFLTAVSVAVAVVPEGLPAVVTVTLALGAQRMLRRNGLIRKLPAVETLGSVTVICSDKTGTLTENRMTVTVIDVAGHYLDTASSHPAPALLEEPLDVLRSIPLSIGMVLAGGTLCNDATLKPDPKTGRFGTLGDPTEGALLVAALHAGLAKNELQASFPRIAELPFDSDRKRMTTVHRVPQESILPALSGLTRIDAPYLAITKGSVDGLLDISSHIWVDEQPELLDDAWRERIQRGNDQLAQNGVRVLGLALQWLSAPPSAKGGESELERDLIFVGLIGMIDPPRPEVKAAVETCKQAGIRPVMITGDHPLTARFIAHDLGISDNGRVKTGQELNLMSPEELSAVVDEVSIYARVSPEHKLRIVDALQQKGHVVAMTGDGVNDSPALKKANIGIAMGISGTDVSKEASDMVLTDDNFTTIVSAVEEGRVIYDNIRRFIKFSIAGNFGKVLVMLLAPLMGISVALLPLQLLWLNLLTDGLLGLGLGVEPAEEDTMQRPPRNPQKSMLSEGFATQIVWVGSVIGFVALAVAYFYYNPDNPADKTWQAMIFTILAFLQIGQALAARSTKKSFFALSLGSNPLLLSMALLTFVLQLLAIYAPFLHDFFEVTPLSMSNLAIAIAVGTLAFVAIEAQKVVTK